MVTFLQLCVLASPAVPSTLLPLRFMRVDGLPLPKRCSIFPTRAAGAVQASLRLGPGPEPLWALGWIRNRQSDRHPPMRGGSSLVPRGAVRLRPSTCGNRVRSAIHGAVSCAAGHIGAPETVVSTRSRRPDVQPTRGGDPRPGAGSAGARGGVIPRRYVGLNMAKAKQAASASRCAVTGLSPWSGPCCSACVALGPSHLQAPSLWRGVFRVRGLEENRGDLSAVPPLAGQAQQPASRGSSDVPRPHRELSGT